MGNSKGIGHGKSILEFPNIHVGDVVKIWKPSVVGYVCFLEFPNIVILIYITMSTFADIPTKPLHIQPTTTIPNI